MRPVYLSPLADFKLRKLLHYLENEWSVGTRNKFLKKIQLEFQKISQHPNICPQSEILPGIHKCVVTKQTSFFYRVQNEGIEIITVFDNRQNSSTIRKEINEFFG